MPDLILRSLKHDVIIMTAGGCKGVDIMITLNVSLTTVERAKSKLKKYSNVERGEGKPGAPEKINALMENISLHVELIDNVDPYFNGFVCSFYTIKGIYTSL